MKNDHHVWHPYHLYMLGVLFQILEYIGNLATDNFLAVGDEF